MNDMKQAQGGQVRTLIHPDDSTICYVKTEGEGPVIVFCGGFNSSMSGTKALGFEAACREAGRSYIRFDYRGHGQSSGKFEDFAIGEWFADAKLIIDSLTGNAPLVLVGSSMGMWVVCLLLREFRDRVVGCVGIAGAPDFTHQLMYPELSDQQKDQLAGQGRIVLSSEYDEAGYPVTRRLFDEGKKYSVLDSGIAIDCPVELFHGTEDADVPWQHSIRVMDALTTDKVKLTLIKGGDHSLSTEEHLALIARAILAAGQA